MDPVILVTARKHGSSTTTCCTPTVTIRVFELDDLVMLIGSDQDGRLLEVGVAEAEAVEFIVHAMPARPMFLR